MSEFSENPRFNPKLFFGFFAFALLYWQAESYACLLPYHFTSLLIPGERWGWTLKACGLLFSALLILCFPWLRRNVGLRWRQAPGSLRISIIVFFAYLGYGAISGLFSQPQPFSLDTILFQATMPSLEEELAYRGIILALLERAFGHSPMTCRWRFGWASLITSLLFWHNVTLHDGRLLIPLSMAYTAFDGAIWALIRTRSGSLLWPMLFHSAVDVANSAVPMIRYGHH